METKDHSPHDESQDRVPINPSEPATLPTALLGQAAKEATRQIARLQDELSRIQSALAATQEEQQLLSRLLAVRGGDGKAIPSSPPQFSTTDSRPKANANSSSGQTLLAEVTAILERAGRPVHVSEILRVLTDRKVPIPGAGRQANVISYLRRDNRIVRPSRGSYALAAWGLPAMPTQRKPRKRTRKRAKQEH